MLKTITLSLFAILLVPQLSLATEHSWLNLTDSNTLDGYSAINKNIFHGGPGSPPLKGVDFDSFQVLSGNNYARDKNRVYYPISEVCVDSLRFGYCYANEYIVKGAKPKSFRYLGKGYATDGKLVFFRGVLVAGADGTSVELVQGPELFYSIKDSKHVFIYNDALNKADPKTFQFWKNVYRAPETDASPLYLLRDRYRVWMFDPPDRPKLVKSKELQFYLRPSGAH
jgi:hypothetical protein